MGRHAMGEPVVFVADSHFGYFLSPFWCNLFLKNDHIYDCLFEFLKNRHVFFRFFRPGVAAFGEE